MTEKQIYEPGTTINGAVFIRECDPWVYNGKQTRVGLFRCICGKEFKGVIGHIKHGAQKSCGCLNKPHSSGRPHMVFPGDKFGRLTVIEFDRTDGNRHRRYYKVQCECGNVRTVLGTGLRSGNTRSCGCLSRDVQKSKRISTNHSEVTSIFLGYKKGAKSRGISFGLSREDVIGLISQPCHYCGSPPSNVKKTKNTIVPLVYSGIDRVDSSQGYRIGNVVPCCAMCNMAKKDFTEKEFLAWVKRVYDHSLGG